MNIYILKIKQKYSKGYIGIIKSFIIRAENKKEARKIANNHMYNESDISKNVWLNSKYSICKIVRKQGNKEVIMSKFKD